ncbi:MAG TPA: KluB [Acetobacteraceae bacterium]|nr:KluB [Acetobacteraceae bacterium]
MRHYRVSRAADVTRDLDLIEEHLVQAYQEFGDDLENAMERAAARIEDALPYMRTFAAHPHRGTEHPKIRPGIRTATKKSFIFYFEIDEPSFEVRILAAFFGGADHRRQILDRFRH